MIAFCRIYFIGGPRHGDIHDEPKRLDEFRIASFNQNYNKRDQEMTTRYGTYVCTGPLRLDPCSLEPQRDRVAWYYEWKGWDA